jgi:hypothetical protein
MSIRIVPSLLLTAVSTAVVACSDQGRIAGTARIVRGPTVTGPGSTASAAAIAHSAHGAAALVNGIWGISPNEAQATIVSLSFTTSGGSVNQATLTACAPTYVRGGQSLSQILECPFTIPSGTYVGLDVGIKNEFQLLVDDSVNGIYTDPSSPSGLSTTAPAGGAKLVPVTVPTDQSDNIIRSTTIFTEPLRIDSASPPSITIVADMIHTIAINVGGGILAFVIVPNNPVVEMVGSATGVGKVEYYNTYGTALNVHMPNVTGIDSRHVRVFYASAGQPTFVNTPVDGPGAAYNASPTANPNSPGGWTPGGYLGLDGTGVLCWALPKDQAYAQYAYLMRMPVPANVGGTTTLSIQATSSVPAPVSGTTYSSGCPTVTATNQWNLTLVAR